MKCWGWFIHDWKCVAVRYYGDAYRTLASYVCQGCGTVKAKEYGCVVTADQLNAFRKGEENNE